MHRLTNRINKKYPNRILCTIKFFYYYRYYFQFNSSHIYIIYFHSSARLILWFMKWKTEWWFLCFISIERRAVPFCGSLNILMKFNMNSVMKSFFFFWKNCVMSSAAECRTSKFQQHTVWSLKCCSFSVSNKMSTHFILISDWNCLAFNLKSNCA